MLSESARILITADDVPLRMIHLIFFAENTITITAQHIFSVHRPSLVHAFQSSPREQKYLLTDEGVFLCGKFGSSGDHLFHPLANFGASLILLVAG